MDVRFDRRFRGRRLFNFNGEGEETFEVLELAAFRPNESDAAWNPETSPVTTLVLDGEAAEVELLGRLKSGKEATVYVGEARSARGARLVAAKFFRPLALRGFRNDAIYQEGRWRGTAGRAVARKTGAGRGLQFEGWVAHEYGMLAKLHACGADVPRPLTRGPDWVLMEFLGDRETAAPMLQRVRLDAAEAARLAARIVENVRLFLASDVVHADLSAFNILHWNGEVRIIDFPQAVDPRHNGSALDLLIRDLSNVARYFDRYGIAVGGPLAALELWEAYVRGKL